MLETLRTRHPRLRYLSYHSQFTNNELQCSFEFLLEPNIYFRPTVTFPHVPEYTPESLDTFIFHLGLIELISYWKSCCCPVISIEAGSLSKEQLSWWHDLYTHGLGEFYFQNSINFTATDFLTIEVNSSDSHSPTESSKRGALVLVGGGKDSIVSLELLRETRARIAALVLNPIPASLRSAELANYNKIVSIRRTIDPTLLKLNAQGYLNGHTPFSAYLGFASMLTARLHGYNEIIASNESSANESNTEFRGLAVNHQYSKSFRFEHAFRNYCMKWLDPHLSYFSFLRPLLDTQIASLLCKYPHHLSSFRSCNVNHRKDSWCTRCPKCAFVFLCVGAILSPMKLPRYLELICYIIRISTSISQGLSV